MRSVNRRAAKRLILLVAITLALGLASHFLIDLYFRENVATDFLTSERVNPSSTLGSKYAPAMGDSKEKQENTAVGDTRFTLPALPSALRKLGSESVNNALIRLGEEATRGNAGAAFDAFQIATFCEGRAALKANADLLENAPNKYGDQADKDAAKAAYERAARVCGDVSPALLDERFVHIKMAADAGLPNAADAYFLIGPRGINPQLLQQLRDDPSVVGWRDSSIALLNRDARKGDINAVGRLVSIYSEDLIAPKNLSRALAYQLVVVELQGRQDEKNKQWLQAMQQRRADEISKVLSESERQAAKKMAEELINNIGNKGAKS